MDDEALKVDKMSFTHPNSNSTDVLDSMRQGGHMRKNLFLDFEFNRLQHRNHNLVVEQNKQTTLSHFLLI